jgi:tetratricopeptide (TPR) repeat protein
VWAAAFGVGPDTAAARVLTAQMMVRAELDEMAEAELKQALARDPRIPHANFLLGQTALFRGRLDEAVALLGRELEVNPTDSMALYRLGDAYVRQLRWDDAVAALQKSVWLNPFFSGPYILLGKAYAKKNDPAAAEGMYRRAVDYDPNNKAAHYLLGQLLRQMGRMDEARRELEIAERLPGMSER